MKIVMRLFFIPFTVLLITLILNISISQAEDMPPIKYPIQREVKLDNTTYRYFPNYGYVIMNASFTTGSVLINPDGQYFILSIVYDGEIFNNGTDYIYYSPVSKVNDVYNFFKPKGALVGCYLFERNGKKRIPIGVVNKKVTGSHVLINKGTSQKVDCDIHQAIKKMDLFIKDYNKLPDEKKMVLEETMCKYSKQTLKQFKQQMKYLNTIIAQDMDPNYAFCYVNEENGPVYFLDYGRYVEKGVDQYWEYKISSSTAETAESLIRPFQLSMIDPYIKVNKNTLPPFNHTYSTGWQEKIIHLRIPINYSNGQNIFFFVQSDGNHSFSPFIGGEFEYKKSMDKTAIWLIVDDFADVKRNRAVLFGEFKTSEAFKQIIKNRGGGKNFRLDRIQGYNIKKVSEDRINKIISNSSFNFNMEVEALADLEDHSQQHSNLQWELHLFLSSSTLSPLENKDIGKIRKRVVDLNVKRLVLWEFYDRKRIKKTAFAEDFRRITGDSIQFEHYLIHDRNQFEDVSLPRYDS